MLTKTGNERQVKENTTDTTEDKAKKKTQGTRARRRRRMDEVCGNNTGLT